jgi:hypothetical protein
MRLRLLRSVTDPPRHAVEATGDAVPPDALPELLTPEDTPEPREPADDDEIYEMVSPGRTLDDGDDDAPPPTNWLPMLADWLTGDPSGWRQLAKDNQISNPLLIETGTAVRVPAGATGRT